jgi:predicted transcriptional regulator
LKGILSTVARTAFPPEVLYKIVAPTVGSDKQVVAYNLCDGETPQIEISKKAKLDRSNLSKSISRWVEAGIVVRVGAEQHPLHLYPLAKPAVTSRKKTG